MSLIPVIGGLVAALAWTTATMTSSRASRAGGPYATLAWVSIFGFLAAIPLILQARAPTPADLPALGWVLVAGAANADAFVIAGMLDGAPALMWVPRDAPVPVPTAPIMIEAPRPRPAPPVTSRWE